MAPPMSLSGWNLAKSSIAPEPLRERRRMNRRGSWQVDRPIGHHARHSDQRSSFGVEVERCHQLHVVFFHAGGGRLQLLVWSHSRRIAPHCRRPDLGGISFCRSAGVESNLGSGSSQPGSRCVPRLACPSQFPFRGQGGGQFYFCKRSWGGNDAALYCLLPASVARAHLAVAVGLHAWHLGAGSEWNFFCGHIFAHTQSRNHAALASFPDFNSRHPRHGASYNRYTEWWRRAILDRIARNLRFDFHQRVSFTVWDYIYYLNKNILIFNL